MNRAVAAILVVAVVVPRPAGGQPAQLPTMCTIEHVAVAGVDAPCTGALLPPGDALDGAECLDSTLPVCEALRRREADVAAAQAASLSSQVTEANARARRWEHIARKPCPPAVMRIVERSRGVPTWVAWAALAAGVVGGAWAGWKVAWRYSSEAAPCRP